MTTAARQRVSARQSQLLSSALGYCNVPTGIDRERVRALGMSLTGKRDAVLRRLMPATTRHFDTQGRAGPPRLLRLSATLDPRATAAQLAHAGRDWRVPIEVAKELFKWRRKPGWNLIDWQCCDAGFVVGLWFGSRLRCIAFCRRSHGRSAS